MNVEVPHLLEPTEGAVQELWTLLTRMPAAPLEVLAAFQEDNPMNDWRAHFVAALRFVGHGGLLDWKEDRAATVQAVKRLLPDVALALPAPGGEDAVYEHLLAVSKALRPRGAYLLVLRWTPSPSASWTSVASAGHITCACSSRLRKRVGLGLFVAARQLRSEHHGARGQLQKGASIHGLSGQGRIVGRLP